MKLVSFALAGSLLLTGCGFVYHPDIPQGTRIAEKQVHKLQVGMSKYDVLQLMGSPTLEPVFEKDRWDYIYIKQPGKGERTQANVVLYFEGDKLARISTHQPEHLD